MSELIQYDLSKPAQTLQLAAELQRFVKEQKLTVNIKGKSYPLVESWQFAGSQLGLIPIIQSVQNISTDSEVKYSATVEVIRIADGCVVSRGFAICSNKEGNKRTWDEYAICSMAQTRATGKAFRNILSWLMKAAGFEATPAEEMDFIKDEVGDNKRDELLALLETSSYEGKVRDKLYIRITGILTSDDYDRAFKDLASNQVFDAIPNPSQKDINNHLKKTIK
jgi:hypothetical protein